MAKHASKGYSQVTEKDILAQLKKIPNSDWQRIESAMTGSGIPDLNGCINGKEFWLELKIGKVPRVEPQQIAWHTRAEAKGRNAFILTAWEDKYHEDKVHYALYRFPTRWRKVDSRFHTPEDGLVYVGSLSSLSSCLTVTYKSDNIINYLKP